MYIPRLGNPRRLRGNGLDKQAYTLVHTARWWTKCTVNSQLLLLYTAAARTGRDGMAVKRYTTQPHKPHTQSTPLRVSASYQRSSNSSAAGLNWNKLSRQSPKSVFSPRLRRDAPHHTAQIPAAQWAQLLVPSSWCRQPTTSCYITAYSWGAGSRGRFHTLLCLSDAQLPHSDRYTLVSAVCIV